MCWIALLAGTSLLALPLPHATARPFSIPAQAHSPEGNLPSARYLELRTQTLAHARLINGPRLKNPNVAEGGLDRDMVAILAEQRSSRSSRVELTSTSAGVSGLLSNHPATLLGSPTLMQPPQQPRVPLEHPAGPNGSSCPVPAVHDVNGRQSPVFTPAEPDNHYRISGCGFGSSPGIVRLQPTPSGVSLGVNPEPIALQLETVRSWADDHIDVHLNPSLTGIPDFAADLVIQLPSGRSIRMQRCLFLAARGKPQLLRAIPAAWVSLDATSVSARAIHQVEFQSPPVAGEELPPEAVNSSAFIARSDPQTFASGKDTYNLSQLSPGWVIESVQLRVFNAVCPGENKVPVSNGSWDTTWTPRGFVVAWADETCESPIPPVFKFSLSSSQYATDVWVIGPAGTRPIPTIIGTRQP